jgi:hypothetical protein
MQGYRARLLRSLLLVSILGASACAANFSSRPMLATAAMQPTPARPLDRSLFSRDPQGQLDEARLQRILAAPLDADLPARVGVLPILPPADWRGPTPDYQRVPAGTAAFAKALVGSEHFSMVTEILPIPSGALGMEALREVAARYQLRYVLLYREAVTRDIRANPWAAGYVTVLGALFMPGRTLEVSGFLEASLFDVKTGLLLFTVRRAVRGSRVTNLWHASHKLDRLQEELATKFAPELARDTRSTIARFQEAAKLENARRLAGPAAVGNGASPGAGPKPGA